MMDNIITVIAIVLFVYLCYRVGLVVNKVRHWRYTREWRPLIDIINGTVHDDPQGGAAKSYLVGDWKGYKIHACMSPAVRTFGSDLVENRFSIGVADQDGRATWSSIAFPVLRITSDDAALAERLCDAGVLSLLQDAGAFDVRYDQHTRCLYVNEIVTPLWAPPPGRFLVLLDLAVALARAQSEANLSINR
jgi:hypothetical protein